MTELNMNCDEMVYNNIGGKITAGGYSVNSLLLDKGLSPLYEGGKKQGSEHVKVSDRFKNLAVPAGLLYINDSISKEKIIYNDDKDNNVVNEDLYDNLLKLTNVSNIENNKRFTKSKKGKKNKKSKTKRKYIK
jgi:hypothetical protein